MRDRRPVWQDGQTRCHCHPMHAIGQEVEGQLDGTYCQPEGQINGTALLLRSWLWCSSCMRKSGGLIGVDGLIRCSHRIQNMHQDVAGNEPSRKTSTHMIASDNQAAVHA